MWILRFETPKNEFFGVYQSEAEAREADDKYREAEGDGGRRMYASEITEVSSLPYEEWS